MVYRSTENSYTADDLRKLQEELRAFPAGMSRAGIAKALMSAWKKTQECMERWVLLAQSYTPGIIDAFGNGKINRDRLLQIARFNFRMPSWKSFLAEKAIKEGLSQKKLDKVMGKMFKNFPRGAGK